MYETVVALLRPYSLLFLVLLVAIASLWYKRRESRGRLLVLTIPLVALQLVSTPAVAHLALGSLEWQYPPLEGRPDCQAIVVLAGAVLPADDVRGRVELADDTRLRCLYAAQLYHHGSPCPIVVSGGKPDPADPGPAFADVMAEFLKGQGVPASDIIIEDKSRTTYENALETSRQLKQRGLEKILLVVDAIDMYRAERCFIRQGIDVTAAPSYYRARPFEFSPLTLVPSAEAARNSERAAHEWLGVLWYACHGRI